MAAPYNPLRDIFRKAHFNTLFRRAGSDRRPYRVVFGDMLRAAWADYRRSQEAKKSAAIRQELREEQNFGLPLASCAFDLRRRTYFRTTRAIGAVGA
jgi:hypothetical protein